MIQWGILHDFSLNVSKFTFKIYTEYTITVSGSLNQNMTQQVFTDCNGISLRFTEHASQK